MPERLLETNDVGMFYGKRQILHNISLHLDAGQALGVIGESGCGKSTLARLLVGLETPTQGAVLYHGQDIMKMNRPARRQYQKDVQMIFQNPYAALNPTKSVLSSVADGLTIQKIGLRKNRLAMAGEALESVGVYQDSFHRLPSEFSGGQLQRVCIARALVMEPHVLICDEPTSSLDVSIQAQIINLLIQLQKSKGLSMIFISHDLRLIRYISDSIAVVHSGELVEFGTTEQIYSTPQHPYTQFLLNSSRGREI